MENHSTVRESGLEVSIRVRKGGQNVGMWQGGKPFDVRESEV